MGETRDDGKELYYHYNHLGSTTAVTDENGAILYRFVYDTYGELSDITNAEGISLKYSEKTKELTSGCTLSELASAAGMEYLYNGQYGVSTDKNSLYYMRARYYDQDIKRFINRDVVSGEITNSQSLNRYAYVQGSPVSLTDPFGLCPDSNSAFKNLCINLYHTDWNAVGHAALDVAGIFFEGADVVNAIWYACEGNMEQAAASALCALPGAGLAAGSLLMKSSKLAPAGRAVRAIAKLTQGSMGLCAGISTAQTGFTNLLNGLEAGTFDAGAFWQTIGGIGIAVLSGKGMVSSGRDLLACGSNSSKTLKGSAQVQTDWDDLNDISVEEFIKAGGTKSNTRPSLPMNLQFFAQSPLTYDINKLVRTQTYVDPNVVQSIKRSISEEGIRAVPPIEIRVHEGEALIVQGHHRLEAYRQLGYNRVPIKYVRSSQLGKIQKNGDYYRELQDILDGRIYN